MEKIGAALIVVDMQNDFVPGVSVAALPVDGGDRLVKPINSAMQDFDVVVLTQDWHPVGHASFASTQSATNCSFEEKVKPFSVGILHGKEQVWWPDHCVQGSWGAQLDPFLKTDKANLILRKGMNKDVDSYSAFRENWGPNGTRRGTGLEQWLRAVGIHKVFICGLAKDYCVRYTAEDAVAAGFRTFVFDGLSRSVNPGNDDKLHEELKRQGIGVIW